MAGHFAAILRTPFAGPWRRFSNPVRVIRADRVDQVHTALDEVDRAVKNGLYAAGFVAYEAAAAFGLPIRSAEADESNRPPLVAFGLFASEAIDSLSRLPSGGVAELGGWQPSIDHDQYLGAIREIKERIAAGDTYQVNFTFRLSAPFKGEPRALMRDLQAAQAGEWSAYVEFGEYVICSASPELFYLAQDAHIECRPMKGTAARGWWPAQDRERGQQLQQSSKNRAENVMIVDMTRNDLGRIAATGSVRAASLFDVERYPLQWQMTSRVTAHSPSARTPEVFAAMFPAGSVTGAPKHSAMQIIRDLETTPRGVYTGAIGYLSPQGRTHFSVAIRTVVIDRANATAEFGVGSGIVWDSVDRDEYNECLIKARMVHKRSTRSDVPSYITGDSPDFRLLETLRWSPESGVALLDRHLARLRGSAACFRFSHDPAELRLVIEEAVAELSRPARVRLLVSADGTLVCEAADLEPLPDRPLRAALAADPVDPSDVFLFHKTTCRAVYDRARASRPDAEAVILWNIHDEITEATDFNVVIELEERKVTPPIACGLLPGTFRAELLEAGEITERRITRDDLRGAGRGWLINSVRGWVPFVI